MFLFLQINESSLYGSPIQLRAALVFSGHLICYVSSDKIMMTLCSPRKSQVNFYPCFVWVFFHLTSLGWLLKASSIQILC